jgi:hypothetical protein
MHTLYRWIVIVWVAALMIALASSLPGCGEVYLSGDALTATETSANDAFSATNRAAADANCPLWTKLYLDENFVQWRSYVRSARRDMEWGPRLDAEKGFPIVAPVVVPPAR